MRPLVLPGKTRRSVIPQSMDRMPQAHAAVIASSEAGLLSAFEMVIHDFWFVRTGTATAMQTVGGRVEAIRPILSSRRRKSRRTSPLRIVTFVRLVVTMMVFHQAARQGRRYTSAQRRIRPISPFSARSATSRPGRNRGSPGRRSDSRQWSRGVSCGP